MTISYDDVQNILKIIDSSALEEVHLELGDFKLVVRRHGAPGTTPQVETPTPPARAAGATASAAAPAPPRPERGRASSTHGLEVKAPMVGTFYRAPAPGAPPFVEVGSLVDEDDTVCILEVMKLMNSIKAGCRGRVAEICVDNAALVEFGATLLVIEPVP
ncbi:MAG: acetyl-CoA carboxylase, biotin carboxyl carrier protein [Candidatus Rokubacteria bacterium 13_1_40CM_68_15]|nr:MAG: acetyl-CoA carboxylase, biotin carboxyl carrier protein [Candidatus Rokubacteria bacterium 13_1_40CM_68_15]